MAFNGLLPVQPFCLCGGSFDSHRGGGDSGIRQLSVMSFPLPCIAGNQGNHPLKKSTSIMAKGYIVVHPSNRSNLASITGDAAKPNLPWMGQLLRWGWMGTTNPNGYRLTPARICCASGDWIDPTEPPWRAVAATCSRAPPPQWWCPRARSTAPANLAKARGTFVFQEVKV